MMPKFSRAYDLLTIIKVEVVTNEEQTISEFELKSWLSPVSPPCQSPLWHGTQGGDRCYFE